MTFFSIIIPVFHVPLDYLRASLNSLFEQSLQECEFIIISDGASSEEFSICEEFAKKDTRFKIFKREHAGVSATRNFGIEQALGEYIIFVDSDDWINADSLTQLSTILKDYSFDALITSHNQQSNGKEVRYFADSLDSKEKERIISDIIFSKSDGFRATPWAKVFKKQFLTRFSILFPPHLQLGEDRVFNYDVFSKDGIFAKSNYSFYHYRERPESLSSSKKHFAPEHFIPYIEELKIHSANRHPDLIAKETLSMLYNSWNTYYRTHKEYTFFPKRIIAFARTCFSQKIRNLIKVPLKSKLQLCLSCLIHIRKSKTSSSTD